MSSASLRDLIDGLNRRAALRAGKRVGPFPGRASPHAGTQPLTANASMACDLGRPTVGA